LDPDSQTPPLHVNSIGAVTLLGSVIQVDVDAINSNLLGRFDSLVIHFEPAGVEPSIPAEARFFGQIDLEAARLVQLINEVKLDQPLSPNLLNWVTGQSVAYNSHSGFAVESIRSASLGGSQLHSEHVINITEGRGSDLYRDWNNDGALEDPGDTVGMLPYLSLMFHIADSQAQEGTEISQLAERLAQEAERLIREITFTREAARQITLADSIDEITGAGWDTELSQALTLKADIDDFLIDAQALDIRLSFSIFETNP
jgi:hypothetical protein